MTGFRRFGTFFVVPCIADPDIRGVGAARLWRLETREDPSRRHWCDATGRITLVEFGRSRGRPRLGHALARQIVIRARSSEVAGRVASLIRAGSLLAYPDLDKYPDVSDVYEIDEGADLGAVEPFRQRFHEYATASYGCHAAAISWGTPSLVYALEKYRFSLERDSFSPHSAHPRYRQVFPNRYFEETYHVAAAFAIVAAFSVIEELGLEIRSSERRPRFLGPRKRRWNPEVMADIEARLAAANIDADETDTWIRRGTSSVVERKIKPKLGKPSRWNRQYGVRDRTLRMPDAIHYCSWLRNYVAAHKFKAITSAISPYDVHNVQSVARRLLLGRLGLWRRF